MTPKSKLIYHLKLVALATSFLFYINEAKAQSFAAGALSGFSVSQITGDNLGGYNKPGPVIGMFLNQNLNEKVILEIQIIYIQKGSRKFPDIKNGDNTRYILNLNYIEVPLLIKRKLNKFYAIAGISNGVLFKQYVANEHGPYPAGTTETQAFRKWELSYNLGISFPINQQFEIEGRINNSILPVRINRPFEFRRINRGQYNQCLLWTLNYKF